MPWLPPNGLRRLLGAVLLVAYGAGSATPCDVAPPEPPASAHHAGHAHAEHADAPTWQAPCHCGCDEGPRAAGFSTAPGWALLRGATEPAATPRPAPPIAATTDASSADPHEIDHVPIPPLT